MIAGIAMVVGGIALMVLGLMARSGRLTRQMVVGLRTQATLASDEAWRAGNQAAAGWVIGAGVVLLAGGTAVMLIESEEVGGVVALIAVAIMLIPLVIGYRRGQAAARSL